MIIQILSCYIGQHILSLKSFKLPDQHNTAEDKKTICITQLSPVYTIYFCKNKLTRALCHQYAGSSHRLDLLLGLSAEELGLDDHGLFGQFAFAQDFVVTLPNQRRR